MNQTFASDGLVSKLPDPPRKVMSDQMLRALNAISDIGSASSTATATTTSTSTSTTTTTNTHSIISRPNAMNGHMLNVPIISAQMTQSNAPAVTLNNFTSNIINQSNNISLVPISLQQPYVLQTNGMGGLQLVAQQQPIGQQATVSLGASSAGKFAFTPRGQCGSNPLSGLVLTSGTGLVLNGNNNPYPTLISRAPVAVNNAHSIATAGNVHRIAVQRLQSAQSVLLSNAQTVGHGPQRMGTAPSFINSNPSSSSGNSLGTDDIEGDRNLHKMASCHQCKTKKDIGILFYCTKTRPFSNNSFKTKKCRKKYCRSCMAKYYLDHDIVRLHLMKDRPSWQWKCPACLLICTCRACKRSIEKKVDQHKEAQLSLQKPNTSSSTSLTTMDQMIKAVCRGSTENSQSENQHQSPAPTAVDQ